MGDASDVMGYDRITPESCKSNAPLNMKQDTLHQYTSIEQSTAIFFNSFIIHTYRPGKAPLHFLEES